MMPQASRSCSLHLLETAGMHYCPDLAPVFLALLNSSNTCQAFRFSELNKAISDKCYRS